MDFISDFLSATDNGLSPERFRRWAAIAAVSAILDRRVWTSIRPGKVLFPNLFGLLVGPPGSGKTMAIESAREIVATQDHVCLAPNSITHERFVELLGERAKEIETVDGVPKRRATAALILSEWGTFLRKPDSDTLSMLADIYDCGDFEAETISRGRDFAENLYITIFAGCTPAWFADGFPPNHYEQGLPTRMVLVWHDAPVKRRAYVFKKETNERPEVVAKALRAHAEKIAQARGFIEWGAAAATAMNEWNDQDFAPQPTDPMLHGYCKRRDIQTAKLAMLVAVSRHPERLVVDVGDFEEAKRTLLEVEPDMPKALKAAGGNVFQLRMEAIYQFVLAEWRQTKSAVDEYRLRQRLSRMVPPNMLATIVDAMVDQKMLRADPTTKAPDRRLTPGVVR